MGSPYDQYYKTENLFGEPSKALLDYFKTKKTNARVLDIGCGQGRNALAIGALGFSVKGIDHSQTGIDQMNAIAQEKELDVTGTVEDMYNLESIHDFDFILLDSMFHFTKNDKKKEVSFLNNLLSTIKVGAEIVICNQNTGNKCLTIKKTLSVDAISELVHEEEFEYVFHDTDTGHSSTSPYKLLVFRKLS